MFNDAWAALVDEPMSQLHGCATRLLNLLGNYPKTGCNPRKIQDLRAFSDSYSVQNNARAHGYKALPEQTDQNHRSVATPSPVLHLLDRESH